ncbi:MAG: HAD family hydrolase [Bacteroidia bacterium]
MHQIKNIIFDLGGVLFNIDYHKTISAFKDLGIPNFDEIYSKTKQTDLFDLFETGKITEEQFIAGLKKQMPSHINYEEIIKAWNAMLLNLPNERVEFLKSIRDNYNIVLLSNTNETHITAFEEIIFAQTGLKNLNPLFDKVYYSSRIKLRKPNAECFHYVLNDSQFNVDETLFFDDSIQHIEGSLAAGIKALHVDNSKTILDFFDTNYKLKTIIL